MTPSPQNGCYRANSLASFAYTKNRIQNLSIAKNKNILQVQIVFFTINFHQPTKMFTNNNHFKIHAFFSLLFLNIFSTPLIGAKLNSVKVNDALFSASEKTSDSHWDNLWLIDNGLPQKDILESVLKENQYRSIKTFSLLTHARAGEILFNGKWYSGNQLDEFLLSVLPENIKSLHIYGCEFAKGEKGAKAVAHLQQRLGISVSASTNMTGKDGDWVLEMGGFSLSGAVDVYSFNLQSNDNCVNNEKVVGVAANFENNTFITDAVGTTRSLAGSGVGAYQVLTYGATTLPADATIAMPWGNTSIKPLNPGLKYWGGNDITGGTSDTRTDPIVSTSPYLNFAGADQFCFDYFDASLDGSDRSTILAVTIYHSGDPNAHFYNVDLTKNSGDATNYGVIFKPATSSAASILNGVNPALNPSTTVWSVKPGWVRICIPLTGVPVTQIRGFKIEMEGINNGIDNEERWGLDNVSFSASCTSITTLPVVLREFRASESQEGAQLSWKTTSETNFDHFIVEKSDNAKSFRPLVKVTGGQNTYSFTDTEAASGLSYYRLKMVDLDGTFAYSSIVNLHRKLAEGVYPNPAIGSIVHLNTTEAMESYRIFDESGRAINASMLREGSSNRFDLGQKMKPGIYILEYYLRGIRHIQKFVLAQ